jgi:hypothetical protein
MLNEIQRRLLSRDSSDPKGSGSNLTRGIANGIEQSTLSIEHWTSSIDVVHLPKPERFVQMGGRQMNRPG